MALTLEDAQQYLQLWLDAEAAVATGQSYKIGSRSLTRVDLAQIAARISYWRNEVDALEAGGRRGARVMRVVPRDY
jgi:hypothetical protein